MHWGTLDGGAPLVIAHRGASGLLPEHTLAGYQLALEQGADLIEPDLVPSADGVLFARHDAGLARSTDIAARIVHRERQRDDDWRCDEFSAAELDQLRAIQPFPGRPTDADGRYPLPRWRDVLCWAQDQARTRGAPVTLYPELKHPSEFLDRGIDPVRSFAESLATPVEGVAVWVQCFDVQALRRVHDCTGLPCSLAVDASVDWKRCLREHQAWLTGLVVDKRLLRDGEGRSTGLVEASHAAGLRVDAWTFRDDRPGQSYGNVQEELGAAFRDGVDGVFCDFPATGLAVREAMNRDQQG